MEPPNLLPKVTLGELAADDVSITLRKVEQCGDGNVSEFELVSIARLIAQFSPNRLLEIGTFNGRTTLNMAANAPDTAVVYTLDLPEAQIDTTQLPLEGGDKQFIKKAASGIKFQDTPQAKKIVQLFGDSANFDFSPYANSVDFIFVDGAHSYEYVKKDSQSAYDMLRPGKACVILWHDYGSWRGVTQALNELYMDRPEFKGLRHIDGTTIACLITECTITAP